jgi:hypothetical protein
MLPDKEIAGKDFNFFKKRVMLSHLHYALGVIRIKFELQNEQHTYSLPAAVHDLRTLFSCCPVSDDGVSTAFL